MAFMKDDTTTTITRVFAPLGHNWFFQIKAFICRGAYFLRLNGDADVNLKTSDQKEENILWQRVSEPAFVVLRSETWGRHKHGHGRECVHDDDYDEELLIFPPPPRRVPNKSISWRILDNRRCRPTSDEVQFIDLEPVDDTNGAKSCFGKALAQRPRTESKYGSCGWRLVFQWETTLCSFSPLIPITAHVESDTRFGAKTANKFSGLDMTASKFFFNLV